MFTDFIPYDFGFWQWLGLFFSALCIGLSKAGFTGATSVMVPILALIFGAKESTGIVLPMLCFADLLAVIYYRRSAEWKFILRLLPWALAGFALALFVDSLVPARGFKILIGICVLSGLAVMLWGDWRAKFARRPQQTGPQQAQSAQVQAGEDQSKKARFGRFFTQAFFGITGGFSTMIGNAAGPVMSVFLLSMRLPKASFAGTAAWFFLIVNYLKIPVQILAWHNITLSGLKLDALMIPAIVLGAVLGFFLVKKISEVHYRILVYILTVVSTVLLFL
jgi:uncharacterized membrane protein YfcA